MSMCYIWADCDIYFPLVCLIPPPCQPSCSNSSPSIYFSSDIMGHCTYPAEGHIQWPDLCVLGNVKALTCCTSELRLWASDIPDWALNSPPRPLIFRLSTDGLKLMKQWPENYSKPWKRNEPANLKSETIKRLRDSHSPPRCMFIKVNELVNTFKVF